MSVKKINLSLGPAILSLGLILTGIAACSSVEKAHYDASANPTIEVNRLDSDITAGLADQYDVLASEDLTQAQQEMTKAKEQIANGDKQETILSTLGYSRAYLNKAKERSNHVQQKAQGILDARAAALKAGIRNFPSETAALRTQDDAFRDNIDKLESGKLNAEQWATLQRGYLDLELRGIQKTNLDNAQAKINGARKNGAKSNAPKSLAQAERDVQNAENVIATDRHNERTIQPAVDKANYSANFLAAVLDATKQKNGDISEDVASSLVKQNASIKNLKGQLRESTKESNAIVSLDQALDNARKSFTTDEAEVYRQGDKLLIRLKTINFVSGRSELPTDALALLAKVKVIATDLNPSQVVVEGHTDSLGSAKVNNALSQERAHSVAVYFENNGISSNKIEAVGYGFQKPLASNKTKEGRAQNRRVDVIITPTEATSSNQ
jgi:OOP family OmpA-OmpF porin